MTTAPITGIRITADKQVERVTLAGLADMQECVGGLIEAIDLADGSTMYANEEGRLLGLPFNSIATDVCGLGRATHMLLAGVLGDVIVGPLRDGRSTDVTETAARWVERVAAEAS